MSEVSRKPENVTVQNQCQFPLAASGQPVPMPIPPVKAETEHTKRMKDHFSFFGPVTFLYALFYAFCMFHNGSGVTFPFFVAGSLLYLCFSLSKLEISLKKGSAFYMISMMLLAVSTFCTDDRRIIAFNKTGIFLLMMSLLLKQFFDTSKWRLGKYLLAICQLVFACLECIDRPFSDASAHIKKRKGKNASKIWYAVLGAVIAAPLFMVVFMLLVSADAVFRNMAERFFYHISFGNVFNVAFRILFLYFASYLLTAYLCKHKIKEEVKDRRTGEPVLAITITGMLSVLYLLFSVVQIVYLFLGQMQLPEGYTYAEYAREGFFQLLAVSILNLIIVLFVRAFFRENKMLKAVLTVMSFCTFIMIASSALRMIIYIQYYYLTFLRILVLWALAVLTFLFLGVVINIFKDGFPLFRYSMVVVTVWYLALSFLHPDYMIARVNVANMCGIEENENQAEGQQTRDFFQGSSYKDYQYLSRLSADAAPVMIPYLVSAGYDINVFYEEDVLDAAGIRDASYRGRDALIGYLYLKRLQEETENFSLRTFNVSRYMAIAKIKEYSSQSAPPNYLESIVIHNDTEALFNEANYYVYIDQDFIGVNSLYEEEIDAYFVETADDGCRLDLTRWRIMEKELPQLEIRVTVSFHLEGEDYKVETELTADENGQFADSYVLCGDAESGFAILPCD